MAALNYKILALGLGLIIALLVGASVMGVAVNADIPGPIYIYMPSATLSNILMYGWIYTTSSQPYEYALVIAQQIGSLTAPSQTISKSVTIPVPNPLMTCPTGTSPTMVTITATLTLTSPSLSNIFMYAANITSTSGSLSGVTIVAAGLPYMVNQTITSATMNGLGVYAYYVSVGSLSYSGLEVTVTPQVVSCSSGTVTTYSSVPSTGLS